MKFLGITALVCGLAAADHYYANPNEGVEQYIVDPRCGAAFDYTSGGPVTHEVPISWTCVVINYIPSASDQVVDLGGWLVKSVCCLFKTGKGSLCYYNQRDPKDITSEQLCSGDGVSIGNVDNCAGFKKKEALGLEVGTLSDLVWAC